MNISTSLALPMSSPLPTTRTLQISPFSSSASSILSSTVGIARITLQQCSKGHSFVLGLGRRRNQRSKQGLTRNALFGLSVLELVVIAGVAVLVFGPKQMPEVGRSIGKTKKSFQQAAKEFESEVKKEPESVTGPTVDEPMQLNELKEDVKVASTKESA